MYIAIIGDTPTSIQGNSPLSCSVVIIPDKETLEEYIKDGRLSDNTRIFECTKELTMHKKVSIDILSLEDNQLVMQYTPEGGLVKNEPEQ